MITPEEFPYIKSLYVNDCYAYKDFNIELHDYKPFSNLILTGKNGSGKSTILRYINNHITHWRKNNVFDPFMLKENSTESIEFAKKRIDALNQYTKPYNKRALTIQQTVETYCGVIPQFLNYPSTLGSDSKSRTIYSFLKASRDSKVNQVKTITKNFEFEKNLLNTDFSNFFVRQFKQYLVNKKINQAFDQLENDTISWDKSEMFFEKLIQIFRSVFDDNYLDLIFRREDFEFFIQLSDGRQVTFDILSEGFSALLSILMDLLVRVDLIHQHVGNYKYDPCGIVLIDEPETHLHLQLQEQVLPLLTGLFPNVQFIAATHSPAVIASIKNATVFDLTTKESRGSEETVGRSYSDLMMSHFGLNNEYSETADAIIKQVNAVLNTLGDKPVELKPALQKIYDENSAYLSPTLKVELELLIAQQEAQQTAHQ